VRWTAAGGRGSGAAGAKRKTRTPHSDVGNNLVPHSMRVRLAKIELVLNTKKTESPLL
jgi:hypothetical protein